MTTVHQLTSSADVSGAPWAAAIDGAEAEEARPGGTTVLDVWKYAATALDAKAVPYDRNTIGSYLRPNNAYNLETHGDVGDILTMAGVKGVIVAVRERAKAVNGAKFAVWAIVVSPSGSKRVHLVPPGYSAGGARLGLQANRGNVRPGWAWP